MTKFITITIVKESEEDLKMDTPVTINTHYIIKIMKTTEDEQWKFIHCPGNWRIPLCFGNSGRFNQDGSVKDKKAKEKFRQCGM